MLNDLARPNQECGEAGGFRFTPYTSAEAFYDGAKDSWDQEQYTAGVQWPYERRLMLETYYLRQNCTTLRPTPFECGWTNAASLLQMKGWAIDLEVPSTYYPQLKTRNNTN